MDALLGFCAAALDFTHPEPTVNCFQSLHCRW